MNVHIYIELEDMHRLNSAIKKYYYRDEEVTPILYSTTPKAFKNFKHAMEISLNCDEFRNLSDSGLIEEVELLTN